MVCITGQVDLALMGNDAFQEVDTVGIVRNVSKYAVTVRDRKDLGRILKEAFYIARTGRPGPVVVDIPKNIQDGVNTFVYILVLLGVVNDPTTVSYTHLDVYKRQSLHCARRQLT